MKRRDFIAGTVLSSTSALTNAFGAISCPPSSVSITGGIPSRTTCPSITPQEDWIYRSTASGVQWAHDFRNSSEFTNFAYFESGDPQDVQSCMQYKSTDGIVPGSGCIEFNIPAGVHSRSHWHRFFSTFPGDKGYVAGSSASSTNIPTPQLWYQWRKGFYAHQDYHTDTNFVGTDFYIQYRVKFSSTAYGTFNGQSQPSGKLAFIDIAGGGDQVLLVQYPTGYDPALSNRFGMYTNFGNQSNSILTNYQMDVGDYIAAHGGDYSLVPNVSYQPGGAYNNSCYYGKFSGCWAYPVEEWVTILIHVIPGRDNQNTPTTPPYSGYRPLDSPNMSSPSLNKDTGIEVWAAREGATNYTKIWEKLDYAWLYNATSYSYGNQPGFNCFQFSTYRNGAKAVVPWWYRVGQVIFSKQFINCPQA